MVWSDPKIQELCREFVTVADESYALYPENRRHLARVEGQPQHRFFRRYGEAMPKGDWNERGTKQGVYMIGPDAEYLEGKAAASGKPADIRQRLERALARWERLRAAKDYANKPVPKVATTLPAAVEGDPFVLRVHSRDLPRDGGEQCRFDRDRHVGAPRMEFTKWAWNENWEAIEDWRAFVPSRSSKPQEVDGEVVTAIAREVFVDNVRGQTRAWKAGDVKKAVLRMERGKTKRGNVPIVYRGEVSMDDGRRSLTLQLYGEALYDPRKKDFVRFELLGLGTREGADRFNLRRDDRGPAPIGFAVSRFRAKGAEK